MLRISSNLFFKHIKTIILPLKPLKNLKKLRIYTILSLLTGVVFHKYKDFAQEKSENLSINSSISLVSSRMLPEIFTILTDMLKNLDIKIEYIEENQENKETLMFNAKLKNGLNEEKSFDIKNYDDLIRMMNFYNFPKLIKKNELMEVFAKLNSNEQVILGYFNEKNQNEHDICQFFNSLQYTTLDSNSHFYLIDEETNADLGLNLNEIYIIKPQNDFNNIKRHHEIKEFFKKTYFYKKMEVSANSDSQINQKILDFTLENIDIVSTENELLNFLRISKEKKIKKFLIYHPLDKNDMGLEVKRLKKFVEIKEKNPEIQVIYTKNEALLSNYFRIIPERYIDTVRLIDFSQSIASILSKETIIIDENDVKNFDFKKTYNEKYIPLEYNMNKYDGFKVGRFKYEGKVTRKRIEGFIEGIVNKKIPQYYECNLNYQSKHSIHLIGKNFKRDVLDSQQDWLIMFYKPGCTSCKTLSAGYEKFSEKIIEIQDFLEKVQKGEIQYMRHDTSNIVNRYKIINFEKFRNLKIGRYNIFNECLEFANPSHTPLLLFFKTNKNKPPIIIDMIKERGNLSNAENVVEALIRIIDNRS